jgi:glucose/mannose-6-phosphate isomerase
MQTMTLDDVRRIDVSDMYGLIRGFPVQAREAVEIGRSVPLPLRAKGIRQIVLCGLGGSAIGGDLLRSYLAGELKVPFLVNRHYTLPRFVGPETLVIVSSYSGNTEETTAAHREAIKRKAKVLCISSNGLTERLAKRRKSPLLKVPGGLPPRAALGYSFFPTLVALSRLGFIADKSREIRETLDYLEKKAAEYGDVDSAENRALLLAQQMRSRLSVMYSSTEHFDAVNTRWRGQIAENAKALSFGHVFPEMNHNELVGWNVLRDQMAEMQVIFLRDRGDHRRVQIRMDLVKEIINRYTPHVTEVWSEGSSLLTRMFSLIYLGDWVSFYLAVLHGEDPTPVKVIDYLKQELARV